MAKNEVRLRLKELRLEAGLTQNLCAAKLDISLNRYVSYETGKCEPKYEFLLQIADFYGVTLDDLLYHKRIRERIFTEGQLEFLRKVRRLSVRGKKAIYRLMEKENEIEGVE